MPINFSSFLGNFFEDEKEFLPSFVKPEKTICDKCGMTYDEFINTGKFGCDNCYEIFSEKIDPILKNIQAGNRHVGLGIVGGKSKKERVNKEKYQNVGASIAYPKEENDIEKRNTNTKLKELKQNLKTAIQEERYEDAAKIRDEIKKLE